MKKIVALLVVAATVVLFSGCHRNMQRDVKRLTHKTVKCFSMVDPDQIDNTDNVEFNECYDELVDLMEKYDKKYSNPKDSEKFDKMYLEELRHSKLNEDFIELYEYLYSLGEDR